MNYMPQTILQAVIESGCAVTYSPAWEINMPLGPTSLSHTLSTCDRFENVSHIVHDPSSLRLLSCFPPC